MIIYYLLYVPQFLKTIVGIRINYWELRSWQNMAIFLLILSLYISQVLSACDSVEVRKEWRAFSTDEQEAWINTVKVNSTQSLTYRI